MAQPELSQEEPKKPLEEPITPPEEPLTPPEEPLTPPEEPLTPPEEPITSPEEPSKPLKSLLRASLVTCPHIKDRDKRFIPRRQLQKKCNVKTITIELKQLFPLRNFNSCKNLASLICHGSTRNSSIISKPCFKIFAILVLMDKAKLIDYFQRKSLCDDDLPFHYDSRFEKMWPNKKEEKDHIQFPGIDDEFIEAFAGKQWSVLAPSFESPKSSSLRCNFDEFDDKTILPITAVSKNKHTGGFGAVERVQLHEEHHEFKHSHFALKTIHSMIPFDLRSALFEQELKAFQQAKPGSHLIDVCAAFKKGENYHFLFPWADGGTLKHLWTKDPQTIVTKKQVHLPELSQWVCRQCHGIIRDLRAIHEPHDASQAKDQAAAADDLYGIHSDIKPDNILHFTDDDTPLGALKVSDLGLMKFHRLISRTVQSKSMGAAYQTYRAPEHDMNMMRSRKVDIWAFGCLFAEFITWAIAGQGGIDHFKNMRMDEDKHFPDPKKGEWSEDHFFTLRTGQPKQKDSVAEWFAHLSEDLGKDTFFPQFLSFIQNSMLHPDRKKRVDCKDVEQFLERCLGNDESSYWLFDGKLTEKYSLSRSSTNSSSWSQD